MLLGLNIIIPSYICRHRFLKQKCVFLAYLLCRVCIVLLKGALLFEGYSIPPFLRQQMHEDREMQISPHLVFFLPTAFEGCTDPWMCMGKPLNDVLYECPLKALDYSSHKQ